MLVKENIFLYPITRINLGKDVLISELDGADDFPIESQVIMQRFTHRMKAMQKVARICDNEKIGINVTNRGRNTLIIEKSGQPIACLSVWSTVRFDD